MMANTKVPTAVHMCAAAWLVAVGIYGLLWPDRYDALMQEDRAVEWATVWLFAAAGTVRVISAMRYRRVFDALVALFCVFVAGEEFSWGQRFFGYYPAEFFLANNFQQEANLHNLPQAFLQPKWVLMIALAGYGLLLPVMARRPAMSSLVARIGATAPPLGLLPWFATAIVLLLWYPLTYTGEWVEAFAGGLFVVSSSVLAPTYGGMLAAAVALGLATTSLSDRLERGRDAHRIACAEQEIQRVVSDIATGSAATRELWRMRRVHKRLWTATREGYLDANHLRGITNVVCADPSARDNAGIRHAYGIDPWGSPYWLETKRVTDADHEVSVYSFGPNRRRDDARGQATDDIRVAAMRRETAR